jgi:hypothetical protein
MLAIALALGSSLIYGLSAPAAEIGHLADVPAVVPK